MVARIANGALAGRFHLLGTIYGALRDRQLTKGGAARQFFDRGAVNGAAREIHLAVIRMSAQQLVHQTHAVKPHLPIDV